MLEYGEFRVIWTVCGRLHGDEKRATRGKGRALGIDAHFLEACLRTRWKITYRQRIYWRDRIAQIGLKKKPGRQRRWFVGARSGAHGRH